MNFENKDELRQALLELHYELLDDDMANILRDGIARNSEVAAEWAATLRLVGNLADAARSDFQLPPIVGPAGNLDSTTAAPTTISQADPECSIPVATVQDDTAVRDQASDRKGQLDCHQQPLVEDLVVDRVPDQKRAAMKLDNADSVTGLSSVTARPVTKTPATKTPATWWMRSTVVAAIAAAIGMLVIGDWYSQRLPVAPTATVCLEAVLLSPRESGVEREFSVTTRRIGAGTGSISDFSVIPASVSFSVLASNQLLFSGVETTDDQGIGRVSLPPELVIPQDASLHLTAGSQQGDMVESSIVIPLEPTRCLSFLTVDRPVYRPGETVFFRSLTLQRHSLVANSDVPIRYELFDPSGAAVSGALLEGITDRGVGNGAFSIPSTAPGGPYVLVAKSLDGFFPDERCEFEVRAYRVPRFKKKLEFHKRSYGQGELVEADFSALHAEGGPVVNAALQVTVTLDGEVVSQLSAVTSSSGDAVLAFELPAVIREGKGQLSVVVDDNATRETESKTIPIQLGRVVVDFYPEGGSLVDGLTNRVYFAARDTLGNPIDLAGEIQDNTGQRVAVVETTRDGMGRFVIVPRQGERYSLKVQRPLDVANLPRLPMVVENLPVMDTGLGVFAAQEDIHLTLRTGTKIDGVVRAVCRGELVGQAEFNASIGKTDLRLPLSQDAGGVIRITVFDTSFSPPQPLVERLVYRRQKKQLQVEIVESETLAEVSPGDPVRLTLQVRDENGTPTPAVLGVSVVDDAALSLRQSEQPGLRTHFLLTSEIEKPEDLEHANFYLAEGDDAAESLDLLLGTQGWRRFMSGDAEQSNAAFREQLIRLMDLDGDPHQEPQAAVDSSLANAGEWRDYHMALQLAWSRLLNEARNLMLLVLGLWLLLVAFNLRRQSKPNLASWLLVCSASTLIYGCGSSIESTSALRDQRPAASMTEQLDVGGREEQTAEMMFPEADVRDESLENEGASQGTSPNKNRKSIAQNVFENLLARAFGDDGRPLGNEKSKYGNSVREDRRISAVDLKRVLASRGLDTETLVDQLLDELRFPVRQYAHRYTRSQDGMRSDFAETICWQPILVTDSQGRATIRFDLSDSVTTFRVNVDGHAAGGRLGSSSQEISSRLPFQIEPKMPLEVTIGDRIRLPVAVVNATPDSTEVHLALQADSMLEIKAGDQSRDVSVQGHGRTREYFDLKVRGGMSELDANIEIKGSSASGLSDSIRRALRITPAGYPMRESVAGVIDSSSRVKLRIPKDRVEGSLAVTLRAYPSPLADVMSGIESILREPHGCFEQTSATNYPNAMALLYLEKNKVANPEVSQRALGMLDRGYQKLVGFECDKLGYEWFGSDPGHEALSAFGLMQFTDMAKVTQVSEDMLDRTRNWLLARRDGMGGFQRNPRHLHVWSVQQPIVNAYVLWAISEADVATGQPTRMMNQLSKEVAELTRVAGESDDPYLIALSAATLMNVQRSDDGRALLEKLAGHQQADGVLIGKTTVTSSGGLSLKMETTALAALAWAKSPDFLVQARLATRWMAANRQGTAGFGSTQATVLALKALVAVSSGAGQQLGGSLQVKIGGQTVAEVDLPKDPRSGSTVEIRGLGLEIEEVLNGKEEIELELVSPNTQSLSYSIDVACNVQTPENSGSCPLQLTTNMQLDGGQRPVVAGDVLTVKADLKNNANKGLPMAVAIIGLPGGVEPRTEELSEMQKRGEFDYYEIRGREIVFYWRTIAPQASHALEFHVTAAIPGEYTGPASRTYLYYTAEDKNWTAPIEVEIEP